MPVYLGTQNTNCLTYIPQDIKYTLVDGVLTVKAGSKAYIPVGFLSDGVTPNFTTITLTKDLTLTQTWGTKEQVTICVNATGNNLERLAWGRTSSGDGSTNPTISQIYYHTGINYIKYLTTDGTLSAGYMSFPILVVSVPGDNTATVTSVDRVFNGFGSIGGAFYILPNVEGNASNGLNPDGTYNIIPFKTSIVVVRTDPMGNGTFSYALQSNATNLTRYNYFTLKNDGYLYAQDGSKIYGIDIGKVTYTDSKITSFTINPVQPKLIARDMSNSYLGTQNTNCLTYIPEDVKVRLDPIAWTQPTLTANGTMGGDSFACDQSGYWTEDNGNKQEAWRMFSEGNTSEWQINNVSTSSTYWAKFYNPEVIKISKFQVVNSALEDVSNYIPAKIVLYGSNDDSTYTEMGVLTDITTTASAVFDLYLTHSDWYKYYKIEVTPRSTVAVAVGRLKITAKTDDYVVVEKGGKTYVPNGVGVYDEIVTKSDLKTTAKGINSSADCLLFVNQANNSLDASIVTKCYTSDTNPAVTYSAWWDTTNNKIYRFSSDSTTPKQQLSFPIAYLDFNEQRRITRIKPLKGFSFFGKRLIGLKGVKGLIPNGYGDNQTFNNIEFEWKWNTVYQVGDANKTSGIRAFETYIASGYTYYDLNTNKLYTDNTLANHRVCAQIGNYTTNSDGNIIDMNINQVQPEYIARKIDFVYNGSTLIKHNFKPITFHTYPEPQPWTVPLGVSKIHVDCVASSGCDQNSNLGGKGGRVQCDLTVTPGETLYFTVGYIPSLCYTAEYNASDIRRGGTEYANRVVVAGGGGSASNHKAGGNGGGLIGADGEDYDATNVTGGGGGTQTSGGAGGVGNRIQAHGHDHQGEAGTLGMGGNAGTDNYEGPRGAGGAGYYGGGSGAASWSDSYKGTAGGGGGSSYTNSSVCSNVTHTQGYRKGAGYITISLA